MDKSNLDEFLIEGASYQRLFDEYHKYGSLCIGFDFDNTVYNYHKKAGVSYNMMIKLLQELYSIGCTLVCWTANPDLLLVENFLYANNIPFRSINGDGIPLGWESKKPFFSALLDDRAGLSQVYQELNLLVRMIKNETKIQN